MRIVIDLQGAQTESRFRGIGRYSLSLVKAIARNAGEHEIWLALNGAFTESVLSLRDEFEGLIPQARIRVFEVPLPVAEHDSANSNRARVAELIREYFLEQLNPDVVLMTSLFEGYLDDAVTSVGMFVKSYKTAVILYDLIPYMDEERYLPSNIQREYYHKKINSLQKADMLLSISEASKKECENVLHISPNIVTNISTAVDKTFVPANISVDEKNILFSKYGITKKMVMYAPGGFDIRKNFENLIIAYSKLSNEIRDTHQLVIVSKVQEGDRHNLENIAKNAGLKKAELIITGYVSDYELIAFYSTCTLFVFPSLHEGFGLPVLEAMACGAAVIGSNTTSIPEVIGLEKALFDPKSVDSIRDKIREALEGEIFLEELKIHSLEQSKRFSWDDSAKSAIEFLETNTISNGTIKKSVNDLLQNIVTLDLKLSDIDILSTSIAIALNMIEKKTIYIDITQLRMVDYGTGIQRVVKAIISEVLKNKIDGFDIELVYIENLNGVWQYKRALDFEKKYFDLEIIEENYVIEPKNSDMFFGLDLVSWIVDAEHQGLFTKWRRRGVNIVFVVYDILPILHPEWWPQNGGNIHTAWLKTIAQVSDKLISISEAVSDDVEIWISKNSVETPKNIKYDYFHLGADIENSNPSKGLPEEAVATINTINNALSFIMVGTIEPRKGHKQTLLAFEQLWDSGEDVLLVIVGKLGWMMDDFASKVRNHPERNKRLFWLEGISDEYLEKVYEASTCLIAASEGEGFGLPLIEAAQHKLPIIARDIPVFREVAGEYAYYFENDNDSAVVEKAIVKWLEMYQNGTHPKSDEMPWLTWEESSKQLMEKIVHE